MTIEDLITLVRNKLSTIGHLKTSATNAGDLEQLARLEIEETNTLAVLTKLLEAQASA